MKNGGELGELADLEQQACEWIRSLQREHGETATPLPEKMREHLARFFPAATVEQVRVPRMPTNVARSHYGYRGGRPGALLTILDHRSLA